MIYIMEDDTLATLLNNLCDSNVQRLVNYITTDDDDIVNCFNLEGALRAEIDAEFNQMETDSSFEDDDEDAMSTSSGFCSTASSISNYGDTEERNTFTYSEIYMNEDSQSSGISMCSSNASLEAREMSLHEVNQSIMDNSEFILKHLQRHSIQHTQLENILQMYKKTLLSEY